MNRRALLIVFWVAASPAFAAPVPKELKKDDLGRFVGEWWECRFENTAYEDAAKARRFTFDKDGALGIRQNAGAMPTEYTIVMDPKTTPPSFALHTKTGLIYNASYHLEADSLRFVLTQPGSDQALLHSVCGRVFRPAVASSQQQTQQRGP